jgi:virginiamycin B lyase
VRLAIAAGLVLLAGRLAAAGTVREFPVPQALFPTGLAVAADGTVLIADRHGDRLIRFAPDTQRFSHLDLEANTLPREVTVDGRGSVWLAASGVGRVDRLAPGAQRPQQFAPPSLLGSRTIPAPWGLGLSPARDVLWFTLGTGLVGRVPVAAEVPRHAFVVEEVRVGTAADRLEGIAVGPGDVAWVALAGSDHLARIGPARHPRRVALPADSRPRAVAVAPDGAVWVTLFGSHRLLRLDSVSLAVRTWPLPSGDRAAPSAVAVDGGGAVWVADYEGNAIVRFDPGRERFVSFAVPTPRARVQALAVDPRGRIWYIGALSRRLGVIENGGPDMAPKPPPREGR